MQERTCITFISVLLLIYFISDTVVNLLLCLIYKLNLITGMYVCMGKKNIVYIRFGTTWSFRHPLGVLECNHHEWGGTDTTSRDSKRSSLGHTNFLTCFPCSQVYALLNFILLLLLL